MRYVILCAECKTPIEVESISINSENVICVSVNFCECCDKDLFERGFQKGKAAAEKEQELTISKLKDRISELTETPDVNHYKPQD